MRHHSMIAWCVTAWMKYVCSECSKVQLQANNCRYNFWNCRFHWHLFVMLWRYSNNRSSKRNNIWCHGVKLHDFTIAMKLKWVLVALFPHNLSIYLAWYDKFDTHNFEKTRRRVTILLIGAYVVVLNAIPPLYSNPWWPFNKKGMLIVWYRHEKKCVPHYYPPL